MPAAGGHNMPDGHFSWEQPSELLHCRIGIEQLRLCRIHKHKRSPSQYSHPIRLFSIYYLATLMPLNQISCKKLQWKFLRNGRQSPTGKWWVKYGLFPADAVSKTGSRWRLIHEIQDGSGSKIPDGADTVSKTGLLVRTGTQNQGWLRFPNPDCATAGHRLFQQPRRRQHDANLQRQSLSTSGKSLCCSGVAAQRRNPMAAGKGASSARALTRIPSSLRSERQLVLFAVGQALELGDEFAMVVLYLDGI